jgi:8-oxo-dGTP pyrophosphatase MutT (NUDIX family)
MAIVRLPIFWYPFGMPHTHDKLCKSVDVFVVYPPEKVVLLRMHDKYGIWLSPGGHNEPGEDCNQAAVREVKEEVGLDVKLMPEARSFDRGATKELVAPHFVNRHPVGDGREHESLVFFAVSETMDLIPPVQGPEASSKLHWFRIHELDDLSYGIPRSIVHYAKSALYFCTESDGTPQLGSSLILHGQAD